VAGQLGKGWEAELESIGTRLSRQGTEGSDATGAAADKAAGDNINAQLQTFINQMSGTVSPNDPIYKALTMYGDAKASSNAAMAGLGQTGMAMAAGQQGGQQAAVPYLQARSGMALQGMNALSQRDLGLRQNALQALQMQNGVTASNYAAQQNQAAMVGSTLGGVLDTVATAYGYPTGGAGAKILGGLGSGSVKPPTMQSPSGGNYSGYGGY
jgi:hypothetical protein